MTEKLKLIYLISTPEISRSKFGCSHMVVLTYFKVFKMRRYYSTDTLLVPWGHFPRFYMYVELFPRVLWGGHIGCCKKPYFSRVFLENKLRARACARQKLIQHSFDVYKTFVSDRIFCFAVLWIS